MTRRREGAKGARWRHVSVGRYVGGEVSLGFNNAFLAGLSDTSQLIVDTQGNGMTTITGTFEVQNTSPGP